jgi:putative heme iron utilization protein
MTRGMTHAREARRYLRAHRSGVLSTLSAKLGGYPFGSIVPFVLDRDGRPAILISALAEHTRNLAADPRASLIVHDYVEDVQTGARLTLVGDAAQVGDDGAVRARYLRYFPAAQDLLALGDFSFWAIAPRRLLFIGGFGRIHWIEAPDFAPPANALADAEEEIVVHMNADHVAALVDYCRHYHEVTPVAVAMTGVDCDGFDVRADGRLLRFEFADEVTDAGQARAALVAMARAARQS